MPMSPSHGVETKLGKTALLALGIVAMSGCGADLRSPESGIGDLAVPSRDDFALVGDAMQRRCGTLDCHGQIGRNLRLFGRLGLRLPGGGDLFDPTTEEEYSASYRSTVGLEPETLSKVVKKDVSPYELAMVRKPRGLESHKGFQLMTRGDALDICIVGWLIGEPSPDACTAVIETSKPPESDGGP
jgi:hypothetical protein